MTTIFKKIELSLFSAILLFAVTFVLTQNIVFWKEFWHLMQFDTLNSYLFTASVVLVLTAGMTIIFTLLLWSLLTFPVIIILLILSTLFNYYSFHYHIYMDRDMLINITETNTLEVFDLISIKLFVWLLFGVGIPLLLLTRIKIRRTQWWKAGIQRVVLIVVSISMVAAVALVFYKDYASFFRNNRQIVKLIMPSSYLTSYVSYARKHYAEQLPFTTIADDATFVGDPQRRTLFVMVVGETARKHNFSLNGYEKETNPLLSQQQNLVSFQDMNSCGTATATSVPCMFSLLTRHNFDKIRAENQENAVDVIQKSGYKVLWRENDHGCKGVCDRVPTEIVDEYMKEKRTNSSFEYDEFLLDNLDQSIAANQNENLMIVLHMNGSHGPTYYQRYPIEHKHFVPSCDTNKIETCSQEALVNTYDNTIRYTDYVLNETVEFLKANHQDYDVAMLYVSDHGESLGESGFYLHGAPYAIAPKEQTEIPMIFWSSEEFIKNRNINWRCVEEKAQNSKYSHDNIFHTLLGLLQVQTKDYDAKLNVFTECQN